MVLGRFLVRGAVGGFLVAGALGVALAVSLGSASAETPAPGRLLPELHSVTSRYHSVEQAKRAGYSGVGEPCVSSPLGTMGYHFTNQALMADDALDPLRPEILIYAPKDGGALRLVAVEYWKRDADGNLGTADDRPTILGQTFQGPMPRAQPVHARPLRPARVDTRVEPSGDVRSVQLVDLLLGIEPGGRRQDEARTRRVGSGSQTDRPYSASTSSHCDPGGPLRATREHLCETSSGPRIRSSVSSPSESTRRPYHPPQPVLHPA